ncbi:type VI secretion system ATPase TssH [Photobacterium lutimaris]|uniref:Type VI secretion system ATPase TssH n=1 Tax=Photobacterium lutimaris TaxID=388278 RepID=A0A2T3IZK8_9GAMM|nr:type VI secretion system ATPase TssH [Photobacterium lutimaris]PSU34139.1 type VI secretion system ATPase TssH [Photobacterium lutimaris]TDR75712.1 type VI secretion system protein VasG [Photobacterium lutimaris]
MSTMTLKSLVDKLAPDGKSTLEAAAALCNSRSHFSVEILHWLCVLADEPAGDLSLIAGSFDINLSEIKAELHQGLEQLNTGNSSTPGLSPSIVTLLQSAWMAATIEFNDYKIDTVHILYALLKDESIGSAVVRDIRQLGKLDASQLLVAWPALAQQAGQQASSVSESASVPENRAQQALAQFTIDLTQQARDGDIDPILGRDSEIRQMIDILTRRRQNNPILTGEAGVGKTAVVEGLAQRIVQGDVPDILKNISIRTLDLALLQAGAGMKGEFENRLKSLIKEVKSSPIPIILFIDEAHTMIGSGGQAGQNDAANLLKPALARGELRTIAATTWAEYKKYFEKDAALTRRFQVVKVEEPDEDTAVVMLRGLLPVMERHHKVTITDKALQAAVRLSHRYINGRQLPDKAVGLLDTACARVAMSQVSIPGRVEDLRRHRQQIEDEMAVLTKEELTGSEHGQRLATLTDQLKLVEAKLASIEAVWRDEVNLVGEAKGLVENLADVFENSVKNATEESGEGRQQLKLIKSQLAENTEPMVHLQVDEQLVSEVISDWTGIPLGRMQNDEIETILTLGQRLKERVIGQDHAMDQIARVVQTARAHLSDERRPDGVFMLTGPSGVGKTESALALAEQIYGSEDNITVINMSEFKEEHKVSLLLGSPPGYVGFGEGGVLTEAVRRKPYSVVLLDEMEKAHPGVQDIFYQVFDKGTIKDGEGRDIDFKNTVIIMTSNVGSESTMDLFDDIDTAPSIDGLKEALKDDMLATFKPAFLGRLSVIPFVPLTTDIIERIVSLQLDRIALRIKEQYSADLFFSEEVITYLSNNAYDDNIGARAIQNNLQHILLPLLSTTILEKVAMRESFDLVYIGVSNGIYRIVFDRACIA